MLYVIKNQIALLYNDTQSKLYLHIKTAFYFQYDLCLVIIFLIRFFHKCLCSGHQTYSISIINERAEIICWKNNFFCDCIEKWVVMIFFETFNSTWKNGKTLNLNNALTIEWYSFWKIAEVRFVYSAIQSHGKQNFSIEVYVGSRCIWSI